MDLDLREYQELAARTNVDLGSPQANVQHMRLGIFTEFGEIVDIFKRKFAYGKEVDVDHLSEEIGDLFWYLANLHNITERAFFTRVPDNNLISKQAETLEQAREALLGIDPVEVISQDVEVLMFIGYDIALAYELDIHEILEKNVAKLKERYPEGFNEDDAVNRDLEAEAEVLGKAIPEVQEALEDVESENMESNG